MGTPVRYPFGVTNVTSIDPLGQYGMLDPTKWHVYFDDFDTYIAGDWVVTETGVATQALTDADGGVLLITNAAADNDASFSQKVGESFLFASGKKLFFKARFKVSDATQSDFVIGLQITDTTPLDVTDGVFFQKDDGDALLDFHVEKDNTATDSAGVATIVSDTYLSVAYYYNGKDAIQVFVDDVLKASVAVTNLPDDEVLTVSYGIQNGEAVAKTMSLDTLFVAKER